MAQMERPDLQEPPARLELRGIKEIKATLD
jgi:hypothetical protein